MKQLGILCLGAAVLAACGSPAEPMEQSANGGPGLAPAHVFTTNTVIPVAFSWQVPCANGGAGEEVAFAGAMHQAVHVTITGRGRATLVAHIQYQGISGTGLVTGAKYNAVGVIHDSQTLAVGVQQTFTYNFRLIGQGPGNNLSIHENLHITIHPDGTVTSFHDNFRADCK